VTRTGAEKTAKVVLFLARIGIVSLEDEFEGMLFLEEYEATLVKIYTIGKIKDESSRILVVSLFL